MAVGVLLRSTLLWAQAAVSPAVAPTPEAAPPKPVIKPKTGGLQLRAQYEERLMQAALLRRGLTGAELDPAPEGKRIEAIDIDGSPVILPGDLPLSGRIPWTFLNRFHVRTRDAVIARELLFKVGDLLQRDVFEESGRNLRSLFILSVARLFVVRGSQPDAVRVLVVTKDQWSLRLNTTFVIDQTRLDALAFQLAEHNLAGRNKRVSLDFSLDPGRYGLGGSYTDPRIWGSRHQLKIVGGAYLNRSTSQLEGGQLLLSVGRPLFSLRTRFGWEAKFQYLQDIARFFSGGELYLRSCAGEGVPDTFARQTLLSSVQATYSMGVLHKLNLTAGWRVQQAQYRLPEDFSPLISDAARTAYQQSLPRSEGASGPFVTLEALTARYLRIKDIQTLALSEDIRIGPQLTLDLRLASRYFGMGSDFTELSATYTQQLYFGDNLLFFGASAGLRVQQDVYPTSSLVNQSVVAQVRNISPRFGPLRLHVFARLNLRGHDLDNRRQTLGSDSGLRGFAPRQFQGNSLYQVNVELRSKALNLWTIHVGGVLFYDGGDTPGALQQSCGSPQVSTGYHQNVGAGLRILLPQFNRDVVRLDLAFPLEKGVPVARFSAEFGQAF